MRPRIPNRQTVLYVNSTGGEYKHRAVLSGWMEADFEIDEMIEIRR